jgi:hypothetical protein
MAYNFQTKGNKIKLLKEYEIETQQVSLTVQSILQDAKELQHTRLCYHVRFENYRPRKPRQ